MLVSLLLAYVFASSQSTKENYYLYSLDPYLMITDSSDYPIFSRKLDYNILNFKIHPSGEITYFDLDNERFYKLDTTLTIVDTIQMVGNYTTDYHDIRIDSLGNLFLIGAEYVTMDLSSTVNGGQRNATVVGAVIQKLDKNKNLLFEWRSLEYIPVTETNEHYVDITSSYIDYFHANSIEYDTDSNIYVSSRHLDEIIKIDKQGNIKWRLGGKNNEFTFQNEIDKFSGQHSIHLINDTILYLFDNGNTTHPSFSRGTKYLINEQNKNISILTEYRTFPETYSSKKGNICVSNNENVLIGWGNNNNNFLFSEYDRNGNLNRSFATDSTPSNTYAVYRADWIHNNFTISNDTILFGTINANENISKVITVTNHLDNELIITGIDKKKECFSIDETFPITIDPKASINLTVRFLPDLNSGKYYNKIYLKAKLSNLIEEQYAKSLVLIGNTPDLTKPEINIYPDYESNSFPVDTNITIVFNERVRNYDNTEIKNEDIKSFVQLKKNNEFGEAIGFESQIDAINNKLTITPIIGLESNQRYCLQLLSLIEDYSDNAIQDSVHYFKTAINTNIDAHVVVTEVYPNPSYGIFSISGENMNSIKIFNSSGRILFETKVDNRNNSVRFDLTNKPKGIYFISISYTDGTTKKITIALI